MKTLQIQTSKADLLLVDLPENVKKPFIYKWLQHRYLNDADLIGFTLDLENDSNYEILGFLDSLSEEQKGSVVESADYFKSLESIFKDYKCSYEGADINWFDTASDSFQSLLDSYNVTRVNTIPEPETHIKAGVFGYDDYVIYKNPLYKVWQSAEQLTFKNPLILIRYK